MERTYTVPLSKCWRVPRKKRVPRAIRLLKEFVRRHMKAERVVINEEINRRIWSRGIEKPPRRIRIKAIKDEEGTVTISLVEESS